MQLTAALASAAENLAWSQAGGHTGMMVSANLRLTNILMHNWSPCKNNLSHTGAKCQVITEL